MRRFLATVLVALTVVTGAAAAVATSRSPIRVTLTAQSHDPRPRNSPSWHWGYCVTVTTATGKSVASTIELRILSGATVLRDLAVISLRKGYDHWCAAIGGEDNVLLALPRGKRLVFQAVVSAKGATVTRSWPIVVR